MRKLIPISQMPLEPRDWYILFVASAEQVIGAALSTIVGIMIPLIALAGQPQLNAFSQGLIGASGLVGIAAGSLAIGRLMDSFGYLLFFRLCPAIIFGAAIGVYFSGEIWTLCLFLFIIGLGVGGGYSLDSGYISELMPTAWENFFIGLAKALSSLGFIGGAAVCWLALEIYPHARVWPALILFIALAGLATFILRLRWFQSPRWLMAKNRIRAAEQTARDFMGPDAEIRPSQGGKVEDAIGWREMLSGVHLQKIILSGVAWACEGLGVYGFGVFLPILVMALGMESADLSGIPRILSSIKSTVFINLFIAAGFGLGLAVIHRLNMIKLMGWGFVCCSASLLALLLARLCGWPVWISFLSFVIFEMALNAGPHLTTFIIPSRIYSVQERGVGMGIAAMLGKIGAVLGVFLMPALLSLGGITLVLAVSIAVQILGAYVSFIYGKKLNLL